MDRQVRTLAWAFAAVTCVGCGAADEVTPDGVEGGPCRRDGSCDGGLVCAATGVCVQATDPCDGVACTGHGRCEVHAGAASCVCADGYHAQALECVDDTDPCAGVACSGRGACEVDQGEAVCLCADGYHPDGLACLEDAGACDGVTCSGHGTCDDTTGEAACSCDPGYHAEGVGCVADEELPGCTTTIGPGDDIDASIGGPGSVLCLESGVYDQVVSVRESGTAGSPIVIRAAPGASPVIDGNGDLPSSRWDPLVGIYGDHVVVDGLEVADSAGSGILIFGTFSTVSHCNVHDTFDNGIHAFGDDSTIEHNVVWRCALANEDGAAGDSGWPGGISAARDEEDGITNRAVIRWNVAYDNWGEGIDAFESEGTLVEWNVTYNNWSVNLYVSDSRNVVVRNNLVYNASPTGGRGGGLTVADEVDDVPRSSNVVVTNNFLYDANLCEACWTLVEGLSDIDVHHNTIVDGELDVGAENGTGIVESGNCIIDAAEVAGLGAVTPGSLTVAMFAGASCRAGTGATVP